MIASISKIKCFKSCRREYELKYVEGLEPVVKSEALETGSNYHELLETLNNTGVLERGLTKEHAMAAAYFDHIYQKFDVEEAEKFVEYQLNDNDKLIGYVDGIASDGCIVEHKTTSAEITEAYEYTLQWDEQILAYMLCTGTRAVWYTVIRKPTIRQKKGETDEEFFDRMYHWYDEDTDSKIRLLYITRTDEEVAEFERQLRFMFAEMERCEDIGGFYRNPAYCQHWGRMCDYAPICLNYNPDEEYIEFQKRESTR